MQCLHFTGGFAESGNVLGSILQFQPSSGTWTEVGSLITPRAGAAVSVVNYADISDALLSSSRQLEGSGTPVDMCLVGGPLIALLTPIITSLGIKNPLTSSDQSAFDLIHILILVTSITSALGLSPSSSPAQNAQEAAETGGVLAGTASAMMLTALNPTQSFDQFMDTFQKTYDSPAEQQMRQGIVENNIQMVNAHNTQFLNGDIVYMVSINSFSDLTFDEFMGNYGGIGIFGQDGNIDNDNIQPTKGFLPLNPDIPLPTSMDFMSAFNITVRNQKCNNCAAQSTTAAIEYCLLKIDEQNFVEKSVQQLSECTDGNVLDQGSQIERTNSFCESGFPDVHMTYILDELNGNIANENNYEESQTNGGCMTQNFNKTTGRVTNFISDIFTDETYLTDSLVQFGPTATNIAVTPMMQFYGGGIYYNPEECTNYFDEEIPEACKERRAGREAYTCLQSDGVNCADQIPNHCDIFFKSSDTSYHHSVTVVGYGEDNDGTQYWKFQNSWGDTWGEEGYMRIAKGLGHCSFGTFFTLPICENV